MMYKKWLDYAIDKMERAAARIGDNIPYQSFDGKYRYMNWDGATPPLWSLGMDMRETESIGAWTNGFWGGILWLLYDKTGKEEYRTYAEGLEKRLDQPLESFTELSHDVGFMWMLTAGANYRRTSSKESLLRLLKTSSHLAGRFNPAGNFIRAQNGDDRIGRAIIDCMMNLPLLYFASELTGDPRFANIAATHADTTLREFIRLDGSVFHVVNFDPKTGERVGALEGQGYSTESSWSRGTGWAIYGFALSYLYTGKQEYLEASKRSAEFFMSHLPQDGVPRADLLAPLDDPACMIDSSAAAIAASGMVLLSKVSKEELWRNHALRLLEALQGTCVAGDDEEALLLHGNVGYHRPLARDIPLIYGDFFYLEALMQLDGFSALF